MAGFSLKKIAEDLFKLEINTIVKPNMSAVKMPLSKRRALYELATEYDLLLKKFKIKKDNDSTYRDPIHWKYAGLRSFGELRDRAKAGIEILEQDVKTAKEEESKELYKNIKMLDRIRYQSTQIVDMFKKIEQKVQADKSKKGKSGHHPASKSKVPDENTLSDENSKIIPSHKESRLWNNDISLEDMNKEPDLVLTPEQTMMIRKAWEIGTEEIVLQTVIGVDGDVTTRIVDSFASAPNDMILELHNNSIETSINFWSNLVKTVTTIAGKAFQKILG
jgi:hypothetical protein